MYLVPFGLILSSLISFGSFEDASQDYKKNVLKAINDCSKDISVDSTELKEMLANFVTPTSENGKCMLACILKRIGLITDGELNEEAMIEATKSHYTDEGLIEKCVEVQKFCFKNAPKGINECETAAHYMTCVATKSDEVGLPRMSLSEKD